MLKPVDNFSDFETVQSNDSLGTLVEINHLVEIDFVLEKTLKSVYDDFRV